MAKTTIEIGFPRSFDLFEELKENFQRFTAMKLQIVVRGRVEVLEESMSELCGKSIFPDELEDLIARWQQSKPGREIPCGFYDCELLLRHYEAGSPTGWTEIEMFKAIRKASIEEWEALIISPAPELEAEPIIPPALLAMDPEELKAFVDHFNKKDPWKGPDYPKMNLASISTGYEEGERCNREGCFGIIEWLPEDPESDCSCHIKPPCSRCTDVYLGCPVCDWDSREVEEGPVTLEQQQEGMIAFEMKGHIANFEAAFEDQLHALGVPAGRILKNVLFSLWHFGNNQWQKGRTFGQEDSLNFIQEGPKPFHCPVGITAVSSECGELDLPDWRCKYKPEDLPAWAGKSLPELIELVKDFEEREKRGGFWKRVKAWWIRFLAPFGGWGQQISDQ